MFDTPFVESVVHPSDFSEASHTAFIHALAIAVNRQGRLNVIHVLTRDEPSDASDHSPRVRGTLELWGLLEPDTPRSKVNEVLSLDIGKIEVLAPDPLGAIVAALDKRPADLVVLATEGRDGLPRWLRPSVAEGVARRSKTMTLFVPNESRGFVSPDNGHMNLKRILVPVDHAPNPDAAITYAARLAASSSEDLVEIFPLHVGPQTDSPRLDLPEFETLRWNTIHREGQIVDRIVDTAEELSADLIVMATAGAKGILGAIRGSVTERVLRRSHRPLLAVPERG